MPNPKIDIIDLFSGYGGFSLGFQQAEFDIENHYYSEIDPHAIACYKHNFPHAKYLGSVTDQHLWDIPRTGNPLVVTFGSPCQDFSLAGRREGLGGAKSSLIEHALLVIKRLQPDFFIWENVKGVFSSNAGADFWAIIQAFADLGPYRLEWELVNSSWFVPQNRERVYVVGHLAIPGRSFREVFPIGESVDWADERATDTPTVRTLTAGGHSGGHSGGHHSGMTLVQEVTNFQGNKIANTLRSGGKGSLTDKHNWDMVKVSQINPCTESGGKQPYQQNRVYSADGIMPSLTSELSGRNNIQVQPVLTPNRAEKRQNGRRIKEDGEPAFTLTAQDKHGIMTTSETETRIRRLTEIECERLQALPDNWTKLGVYQDKNGNQVTKEIASTQRYKLCGNGVTVAVVKAIALKLRGYFE